MEEIRITLETLYDILRNEKKKEELQKLEETFLLDVGLYLKEKKILLESKSDDDNIFAAGEKDKLEYELRSIKRILKEIYEKREKKIIDIAINRSRTGSDIIDTSCMLKEEKEFYQDILGKLDYYRRGILLNLFKGELPQLEKKVPSISEKPREEPFQKETPQKKQETLPVEEQTTDEEEKPVEQVTPETTEPSEETQEEPEDIPHEEETPPEVEVELTKVKFVKPMPSFVWKDMKKYGPFDPGEELEIFSEVAELLVRKGRAEKV